MACDYEIKITMGHNLKKWKQYSENEAKIKNAIVL